MHAHALACVLILPICRAVLDCQPGLGQLQMYEWPLAHPNAYA